MPAKDEIDWAIEIAGDAYFLGNLANVHVVAAGKQGSANMGCRIVREIAEFNLIVAGHGRQRDHVVRMVVHLEAAEDLVLAEEGGAVPEGRIILSERSEENTSELQSQIRNT